MAGRLLWSCRQISCHYEGVCQLGIRAVLGDSLPIFRAFSTVFPIELVFYNDFPIETYIVLLNPCMHQILKSVTESFNLEIHSIMSGRGRRGRSRTSAPEAPPERYVEHTPRSEKCFNESSPSRTIKGCRPRWRYLDDGSGYTDCYSSYPLGTGASRRAEGHDRTRSKIRG